MCMYVDMHLFVYKYLIIIIIIIMTVIHNFHV